MAHAVGRSDPGRVRTGNEDAFLVDPGLALFAVADGMGGHSGGEIASKLTVETLSEFIKTSTHDAGITWPYGFDTALSFEANQLKSAVQLANQQIRYHARLQPEYDGMGSTVIALIVNKGQAIFANVGDSRLYMWRRGALTQLSEDDSWAASMIRAGATAESIRDHDMRHMLTKALGSASALDVDVGHARLEPGDVLLMCSDGLHGPLGDDGIARVLGSATDDLEATASALVDAANAAGGPDNVTAVLVRYDGKAAPRPRRKLSGESGQTISEYVVMAGLLVAIGILVSGMLIPAFRVLVLDVAHEVSFLSP